MVTTPPMVVCGLRFSTITIAYPCEVGCNALVPYAGIEPALTI